MPRAVLPLLVGEDEGQVLEDVEVEFPEPAVEIDEPVKRVEITRCEAIPGKVIIVGRVVKNTLFACDTDKPRSLHRAAGLQVTFRVRNS